MKLLTKLFGSPKLLFLSGLFISLATTQQSFAGVYACSKTSNQQITCLPGSCPLNSNSQTCVSGSGNQALVGMTACSTFYSYNGTAKPAGDGTTYACNDGTSLPKAAAVDASKPVQQAQQDSPTTPTTPGGAGSAGALSPGQSNQNLPQTPAAPVLSGNGTLSVPSTPLVVAPNLLPGASSAAAPTGANAPPATTADSDKIAASIVSQAQTKLSNDNDQLKTANQISNSLDAQADQAQAKADQAQANADTLATAAAVNPTDQNAAAAAQAAQAAATQAQTDANTADAARAAYNANGLQKAQNAVNADNAQQAQLTNPPAAAPQQAQNGNPTAAQGTTSGNSDHQVVQQLLDQAKANKIEANKFAPSNDDCALSAAAGGTSCSGMRTTMATTQIAAKVASQIGSQAVNMIGQQQQQSAMLNGASMATIYQGSAAMSAKAAEANIGMGAVQLGMGVLINNQAGAHSKEYSTKFKTLKYGKGTDAANGEADVVATGGTADTQTKVYENSVVTPKDGTSLSLNPMENGKADIANQGSSPAVLEATQKAAAASAQSYAHAASVEQNTASVDGHAAALTNMAQGGGAMVSGAFQYAQAKAMENLYAQMAAAPTVTAPGADAFAAPGAITGTNTITGSGTNPNTAAATAATAPAPASSGGPLGAPLGNIPTGPEFGTPTDPGAGAQAAATPGPQGGSLGGAAGGIGTSAVPGGSTDEKPATYDTGRNAAGYEGVGGFAAGGTGSGKGNSNDPTIDPKTLMAAMLDQMGQKKDDDQAPGILNYRTLASDANAPLPAEENFFTRFHADYQEFQRKGQVGL
jgi:hypothetical protein